MPEAPTEASDEVVLVTGGTRGIGRRTARLFAERGATVVANYHADESAARDAGAALADAPGETAVRQFDVGDYDAVADAVETVEDEFGQITTLVTNAGIMRNSLLLRMDPEEWQAVVETNLTGTFNCARAVARSMLLGEGGAIVCVSSVAARRGWAGQSNYAASKAGVEGFVRSLARELADRSVRVNAVAPGYTRTDMFDDLAADQGRDPAELTEHASIPQDRAADPEEIAETIYYLASDRASYVTGEVVRVDGGLLA